MEVLCGGEVEDGSAQQRTAKWDPYFAYQERGVAVLVAEDIGQRSDWDKVDKAKTRTHWTGKAIVNWEPEKLTQCC